MLLITNLFLGAKYIKDIKKHFLSYFVNSQTWLNWLMDVHHLSYITKLEYTYIHTYIYNTSSLLIKTYALKIN